MPTSAANLYKTDFYAWTRAQARELRRLKAQRSNTPLDLDHLAQEVQDLGNEQFFAVRSQLVRLMINALKLDHSGHDRPRRQWLISALSAQDELRTRLTPSIRRRLISVMADAYAVARKKEAALALEGHGEAEVAAALPAECPWGMEEVVAKVWKVAQNQPRDTK